MFGLIDAFCSALHGANKSDASPKVLSQLFDFLTVALGSKDPQIATMALSNLICMERLREF